MGRVWRFGDNIDTDALAPGQYMHRRHRGTGGQLPDRRCAPEFAASAGQGDVIVAGRNFGMGSSREQAAQALKLLGVAGVVAESFAGIFYRNAINLGLPVFAIASGPVPEDGTRPRSTSRPRGCAMPGRRHRAGTPAGLPDRDDAATAAWCRIWKNASRGAKEPRHEPAEPASAAQDILVAPGVYDALSAHVAEQAGAEALYLSGASIAYTRFGSPDIGLVGMREVAETVALIRDRVTLPLDRRCRHRLRQCAERASARCAVFERMGANAIQLEDQTMPKRCGHLDGKTLVSRGEMVGKIRAALRCAGKSTRRWSSPAPTPSPSKVSRPRLDRAEAYVEAGADMLFVEAPQSTRTRCAERSRELGPACPLMANMVEGGKTPLVDAAELQALGFRW